MIVPAPRKPIPLLRLFVDGASRGNPGPAAAGVVITDAEGATLAERGYYLGKATNNVAEYEGLIRGLELAAEFHPQQLDIFADSELVVRQITGEYRVRSADLLPLYEHAQLALLKFDQWQIRHVPREKNARADRLANLAINAKGEVDDAGEDAPSRAAAEEPEPAGPAVQIKVVIGCDPRACPGTMMPGEAFHCDATTPKGLCVHAACAILPAVAAMLDGADPSSDDEPEVVQIACPRPNCHAIFELTWQA